MNSFFESFSFRWAELLNHDENFHLLYSQYLCCCWKTQNNGTTRAHLTNNANALEASCLLKITFSIPIIIIMIIIIVILLIIITLSRHKIGRTHWICFVLARFLLTNLLLSFLFSYKFYFEWDLSFVCSPPISTNSIQSNPILLNSMGPPN